MTRRELDVTARRGRAHVPGGEQAGRRGVEAPVRQRDGWVDRLELALEVEQHRTVPRQEPGVAMSLLQAETLVHAREVRKGAGSAVVERAQSLQEPAPLGGREAARVLSHPDH